MVAPGADRAHDLGVLSTSSSPARLGVFDRVNVFTTRSLAGGSPKVPSNVAKSLRMSMDGGLLASSGTTTVLELTRSC